MAIEKKPFRLYDEYHDEQNKTSETLSLKINKKERKVIDSAKEILNQSKDGTTIKNLMLIGAKVIHDDQTRYILDTVFKNKKNNERSGIVDYV